MWKRFGFLTITLAAVVCPSADARSLPEPVSYTKPVPDSQYVFVQLGDPAVEEKQSASAREEFRALRAKYPKSGLYRADGGAPVWELDAGYVPYDNVFPSADGVHLARLEGDWWIEREYPSPGKRLAADEEAKQFAAPAVGFYTGGKLTRAYPLKDLIVNPADLKHSPRYVLWVAGGVLNEGTGRFIVMTQDAGRVSFDFRTGEVTSRDRIGLNNPMTGRILLACGVLSLGVLGAWAWFAFGRRSAPVGESVQ